MPSGNVDRCPIVAVCPRNEAYVNTYTSIYVSSRSVTSLGRGAFVSPHP